MLFFFRRFFFNYYCVPYFCFTSFLILCVCVGVVLRNYLLKLYPAQLSFNKMYILHHTIQTVLKMIFIVFHQITNPNIIFILFYFNRPQTFTHKWIYGMRNFVVIFIFRVLVCFINL